MPVRPDELPRWATDAGRTLEPSGGEKDVGWELEKKPPARKMNWIQNRSFQWHAYTQFTPLMGVSNFEERVGGTKAQSINDLVHELTSVGATRWVAVGNADGGDAYILLSKDRGVIWAEQTNPRNETLNGVDHDGSALFVAVGTIDAGGDAYIISSADGEIWAEETNPKGFNLNAVAHDQSGLWVAVGRADGTDAYIVTSVDGSAWNEQTNPKNLDLNAVAYDGSGLWFAVGEADGGDAYIITSTNGEDWEEQTNPRGRRIEAIAHDTDGLWLAVGDTGGGAPAYVISSDDGKAWTEHLPSGIFLSSLFAVANDKLGRWVVAGEPDANDPYIGTSIILPVA